MRKAGEMAPPDDTTNMMELKLGALVAEIDAMPVVGKSRPKKGKKRGKEGYRYCTTREPVNATVLSWVANLGVA
jgi:hypothetical protein